MPKTPIAFFANNRSDTTKQVFEAIRKAILPMLLAADGRRGLKNQARLKKWSRRVGLWTQVDWDCKVKSDKNLGYGLGKK